MKAILMHKFGSPEELFLGDFPLPVMSADDILVSVKATALNRADILQRQGHYPPPPGASPVLGLEMSGTVEEVGQSVRKWKKGDRVFGLLPGGGYAEFVTLHQDLAIGIPDQLNYIDAAAIPEVYLTAFQAITYLAAFRKGETILIHAGASGVGTASIQLAGQLGAANIAVTASLSKHPICQQLGADKTIDYRTTDFAEEIMKYSNGRGVDVIIDFIGAPYFQRNIDSLAADGRLIILAFMGGTKIPQLDMSKILFKRLRIIGSTLRARSLDYKIKLTKDFSDFAIPLFKSKKLKPVIDSVYDWKDVVKAHQYMEANENKGKIILEVS